MNHTEFMDMARAYAAGANGLVPSQSLAAALYEEACIRGDGLRPAPNWARCFSPARE